MSIGAALALLLAVAWPAQAAGYRYWSFWQTNGGSGGASWAYATQGPATARPADGEVNGFRFSVSSDSADSARPRTTPDFAALCAGTPAKDGTKRVGVVIDFGTPADAAAGETPPAARTGCAQVRTDATSAEALAAVAKPLRYNSDALLCAISGYPASGCGEQVSGDTPEQALPFYPTAPPSSGARPAVITATKPADTGPSVGVLAGVAAVLALGAAALWQARRRRG
ncbi:SCO2322 family protein [Streptomyces sp. NPDC000410]|uniref:SCO2322 family protein n=1 Tax=Streptomyces sp. NPDC000410 TaxID=3154254 RepID=UPI0033221855